MQVEYEYFEWELLQRLSQFQEDVTVVSPARSKCFPGYKRLGLMLSIGSSEFTPQTDIPKLIFVELQQKCCFQQLFFWNVLEWICLLLMWLICHCLGSSVWSQSEQKEDRFLPFWINVPSLIGGILTHGFLFLICSLWSLLSLFPSFCLSVDTEMYCPQQLMVSSNTVN